MIPENIIGNKEAIESWFSGQQKAWVESLKPKTDQFGLRHLPREPNDPNRFLSTFKTDRHTYTIVGEHGIGFPRYTIFQKRSLQRGFGRNFQQIYDEWKKLQLFIGSKVETSKLITESIINIQGILDSVADFGKEQFDAVFWLCTLFVLREDEVISSYSEQIAEEKIRDWADFGYSELDFFLLSGQMVPGYGSAFNDTLRRSEKARQRMFDNLGGTNTSQREGN